MKTKSKHPWPIPIRYVLRKTIDNLAAKAAATIFEQIPIGLRHETDLGIVLGTGMQEVLGKHADFDVLCKIPFKEFMPFPMPPQFAYGHKRELVIMLHKPSGKLIAVSYGRIHFYETDDQHSATFMMRVFKALGCQTVILLSAAGGCQRWFKTGDFVFIAYGDLYKMKNSLRGLHPVKFKDPVDAYDEGLRRKLEETARLENIPYYVGMLSVITGFSYESWLERLEIISKGVATAGMSNFNEAIVGYGEGLGIVGINVVTNLLFLPTPVDPKDIEQEMINARPRLDQLLSAFLIRILCVKKIPY